MARINPDANDLLVYKLDETSGPYRNTGITLPNNSATDLSVTGTVIRTGNGVHSGNCLYFPGTGNFPTGASATRNYVSGANTINPQPPFSMSFWVNQRNYVNNGNFQQYVKKLFRDHTTTNTSAAPFFAFEVSNASTNSGQDLYFGLTNSITTQTNMTITDFPMPLFQWNHIGMTHDGTNIRAFLNGCQLIRYSGTTQLNTLAATTPSIVYNDINYGVSNVSATGQYVSGIDDIGNHGDEVRTSVNFPFPVTIYGATYNSGFVGSNGQIEFGQNTAGFNFTLPNASFGNLLCIFQKDQDTTSPKGIFTTTTGTSPNRVFIVEWRNQPFGGGSTLNYEAKFFENTSAFEFLYDTSTSVITACVGIQSQAGGKTTVFNNAIAITTLVGTKLVFTPTTSASGYLAIGATPPYLVTSSPTKEEANFMISDLRIASVARPLSYFQQIYNFGILPNNVTAAVIYYKLRAYDLSCSTPTPVTWVDTQISLANAPSFPCSGPYSPVEVVDTWLA